MDASDSTNTPLLGLDKLFNAGAAPARRKTGALLAGRSLLSGQEDAAALPGLLVALLTWPAQFFWHSQKPPVQSP